MLLFGWSSDRTGERRWHAAGAIMLGAAGYLLVIAAGGNPLLVVAAFCVVAAGADGYFPGFWPLPTAFLTESAAAAAIGLINSVGNLGGFFGPYVVGYLDKQTGSHYFGIVYLSISALIAAMLALTLRKAGLRTVQS